MGHRNDAADSASLGTLAIVENQLCGLLTSASVQAEYIGSQFLSTVGVRGKYILV